MCCVVISVFRFRLTSKLKAMRRFPLGVSNLKLLSLLAISLIFNWVLYHKIGFLLKFLFLDMDWFKLETRDETRSLESFDINTSSRACCQSVLKFPGIEKFLYFLSTGFELSRARWSLSFKLEACECSIGKFQLMKTTHHNVRGSVLFA